MRRLFERLEIPARQHPILLYTRDLECPVVRACRIGPISIL